ncbi:hypothetical protein [Actinacidiphila guanduensis]|uniref:Uncharacterized protein n=1 Tax=Actinacidiphila guanduensis TaxID=310781 RepID=A0A1H0M745_9ACTN|nr:hypothetical protein [Actinacidiphila guanduensis]SDO76177.1 hypothetical protein SAMN05216259_11289 [Actinacidiphila guanduensis]
MPLPGGVESPYENADGSDSRDDQYQPQSYPGGAYVPGSGTVDTGQRIPDMPDVPRVLGNGSGTVSADTTALKVFADNLETIYEDLGTARQKVNDLQPLRAGGEQFVEAQTLTSKITGPRGGEGLQGNYLTSLHALRKALKDTADGIRDIAAKYSTIEELNAKAGSDLTHLIQDAQSDIQKLQSATGDSGTGTGTTTTGTGDTSGVSGSPYGLPYGSGDTSGMSGSPYGASYGGSGDTSGVSGSPYGLPYGEPGDTSGTSGSSYGASYGGSGDTSGVPDSTYPSGASGGPYGTSYGGSGDTSAASGSTYDPSYGDSAATPSMWGALPSAAPSAGKPPAPDDWDDGSSPTYGLTGEPAPVAEGPGPVVHPGEAVRVRLDPSAPQDSDVRVKADDVKVRADGASDPDVRVKADDVRVRADGTPDPDVRVKADGMPDTTLDKGSVREKSTGLPGF